MSDFYLTRRLQQRTYHRPDDRGLDVNFQLDYMGSSGVRVGRDSKGAQGVAGDRQTDRSRVSRPHGRDRAHRLFRMR